MNRELTEFIAHELVYRSETCKASLDSRYTIAAQRQRAQHDAMFARLQCESTPFRDWRRDHAPALWKYGTDLIQEYLEAQLARGPGSAESAFRTAALMNFHPHGSHFDCYLVRLFVQPAPGRRTASHHGRHELPWTTATPIYPARFDLRPALYDHEEQLHIVDTLFRLCEDYFLSIVMRFGPALGAQAMASCWDMFRRDVGNWLPHFRRPRCPTSKNGWHSRCTRHIDDEGMLASWRALHSACLIGATGAASKTSGRNSAARH